MKQHLLLLFILLLKSTAFLYAQDAIYTINGNRIDNAQITDLTEERIIFKVQSDKVGTRSFQRQNVLVAFRKGNFLVINKLSNDLTQAKQELQTFLTTTAWQGKDYLLKAVPFEIIPATIRYDEGVIVNYLTNDNKPASIPKSELIAIFHKDGRHTLLKEPSEVTSVLADVEKLIGASSSQTTTPTSVTPAQATPQPSPVVTPTQAQNVSQQAADSRRSKLTLSDTELQYYRKKGISKVDEFASYLNVITDKSQSMYARNQAIDQAASLFMPAATIEVTSNNRPGSRKYTIRTYLNNLKLLPYSSTQIEWTEIQYLKELTQATDGNYYGVITAQQTFIGRGNGTLYSDVTPKNVRVKLERYHLIKDGQDDVKWNLLLGSIGVSVQ
ncbi:hypothetical protein GCM10027592_17550 [Spirosoma flavus]